MVDNGAAFFNLMSKGKQNKFEVKTINSTLGFLETGLIREQDDLKHGVAKFTGEAMVIKLPPKTSPGLLIIFTTVALVLMPLICGLATLVTAPPPKSVNG